MKRSSGNGERLDDVRRMALIQRVAIIATTVIVVICCVVVRVKRHEKQEIERQRMEATYPGQYDADSPSPELITSEEYPSQSNADNQRNGVSQDAGIREEKRNYNQHVIDKHAPKPKPGSGDHGYWEDHEDWEDYYDDNEEDLLYDY